MRIFSIALLLFVIVCPLYGQHDSVAVSLYSLTPDNEDIEEEQYGFPILSAYNDIYSQMATYNLMFVRYRNRGYDNRFSTLTLNGADLTDPFTGSTMWGMISGLNLVTKNRSTTIGISRDNWMPGGIGVSTDIHANASDIQPELRLNGAYANRAYDGRVMGMYSSGIGDRGWGGVVAASRYWGASPLIDGVFTDSWAVYGNIEKQFGDRGSYLSLTLFCSPSDRGIQSAATAEAFSLTNYQYNPAWGYQDNRKRNAKVRENIRPTAIINHSWRRRVNTTAMISLGQQSYSGLGWRDAPNPYPDYYRYMPSFFENPETRKEVEDMWRNDPSVSQIDWQRLYNENNYDSRAKYMVESRVSRDVIASLSSTYNSDKFDGGVKFKYSKSRNFKRMEDLLGASYWLDIDQYVEQDEEVADKYQNDMRNPNRHIKAGDTFGYNYDMDYASALAWGNFKYSTNRFSGYIGAGAGLTAFRRKGNYEKELFLADASYGPSEILRFTNYSFRAGAEYIIGDKSRIGFNAAYLSEAPRPNQGFVAPRIRNAVVDGLRNEEIMSFEATYRLVNKWLRLRLAAYYTTIRNQTEVRSYYDDLVRRYSDYVMTGVDERHIGLEAGAEFAITDEFSVLAAASAGYHTYISDPSGREIIENTGVVVADNERVLWNGKRVGGTPQIIGSLGFSYRTRSYWSLSATLNYFADNFIRMNPMRRTERFLSKTTTDTQREVLDNQERLSEGFTLDVFGGKSFRIARRHIIGIYASVNNLLGNTKIRSGGYEQSRVSRKTVASVETISPFPNKYYNALGRTFFVTINYRLW